MTERNYIPENQQVNAQAETPEQRRPQERASSGLRRIKQVGPLMAAMLAVNLGLVGAAKAPDSREPEVETVVDVDLLNGTGSFETPASAPPLLPCAQISSPQGWCAPPHSVNVPNPNFDYQNGFNQDGLSSVDTSGYITGNILNGHCETDTNSWKQSFPAAPGNTYTVTFANYVPLGASPDLDPRVIIKWKNGTPDTDDRTFHRTLGPDFWENDFSGTYVAPAGTTSGEIQVGVGSTKTGSCTVGTTGKEFFDVVKVTGPAPTPPSVGGIAEMPDLPPATISHSPNNTIVEIAIGGAAALAAAAVAGAEINKRRKPKS